MFSRGYITHYMPCVLFQVFDAFSCNNFDIILERECYHDITVSRTCCMLFIINITEHHSNVVSIFSLLLETHGPLCSKT